MTAKELRKKYIEFFVERGHAQIKSASLIPENDPTVLFTTAGMHPLVPFLLGEKHPNGKRLVNYQKCIRTGDIEEVGDDVHLTFFEMLGNWSLGDYFKKEAIEFSLEFLTSSEYLNLSKDKLAVSVFAGDEDAPFDKESFDKWISLEIPEARIAKLGKKDNWWGPAGKTGPCGPDTEMFYWTGPGNGPTIFDPTDRSWVEIWNDVFMEFFKTEDGSYESLRQPNVDTGMGVERVTAILQKQRTVYETELFTPIFQKIGEIAESKISSSNKSARIIAEHLRSATFILAAGISPSNLDQGYVLRRLIRRSVREGKKIGINGNFTKFIANVVVNEYAEVYPELESNKRSIFEELDQEENLFSKTLEKGLREFNKLIASLSRKEDGNLLNGQKAFSLYETYGFPIELTKELAQEHGLEINELEFNAAYKEHQERSRQGAEAKFKGGLADDSEETTKLHTATHLLHQALRMVLGKHVAQKGSNITKERLRFDFSHPEKVTKDEIEEIEGIVNEQIKGNLEIKKEFMTVNEAKFQGAIGLFEERYGEEVSVYSIGDFSKEICGGPHVENTRDLGKFKIKKEESSSRGIRRIKAVLK